MTTIKELAALAGGRVVGDEAAEVRQVSSAHDAREGEITYAISPAYVEAVRRSRAAAVFLRSEEPGLFIPQIIVAEPKIAAIQAAAHFAGLPIPVPGVKPGAFVHPDANVAKDAVLYPGAYVGAGASIGPRTILMPGAVVMERAKVGSDGLLYPNVFVGERCVVGDRAILHAGASIGADGFGFYPAGGRHLKIPQLGIVEIGDDVEIGACSCVDRATVGRTVIGEGTKIDNLVQIGHNCLIGKHCVIVAQTGLAGSVRLGDNCVLGARAGVTDNVSVGKGSMVAGYSGVAGDLPEGSKVGGTPAIHHLAWKRGLVAMKKLPQIVREVERLIRRVAALEEGKKEDRE